MEDHHHHQEQAAGKGQEPNSSSKDERSSGAAEPVRSRWIPKPEQILILESIFNSGMVNPPKEETVRIRKLLETFGSVGDANVFYWFQNRRSRSRRRQRQLQASLDQQSNNNHLADHGQQQVGGAVSSAASPPPPQPSVDVLAYGAAAFSSAFVSKNYDFVGDSSSSSSASALMAATEDSFYFSSGQIGFPEIQHGACAETSPAFGASSFNFQTGMNLTMTVYINGVAAEVPRGPLDMKAMFGTLDVLLVHSSGVPLPINEFGFLAHGLQPGESYFLVSLSSTS